MRLYSLTGATGVDHAGTHYEPADDGGFDFPAELEALLSKVAVAGVKQWETSAERSTRLHTADVERKRSPEALYDAVSALVDMFGQLAAGNRQDDDGESEAPEAAGKTPRRTRAKPAGTAKDPASPPA